MDHGSKKKVAQGVAWASAANWGCQILGFGVYTGLARLLNPQAFGLVAIAAVYIAFIQVFVNQGFGSAVIQRHELEEEHLDSAFWITVLTALVLCALSLLLSGEIARLFHEPKVAPVIRWLALSLFLFAFSALPTAILTRELDFRSLAIRSLIATAAGGAAGLAMAYSGWGVWSLVGQQLVNATLGCIFLWWAVPWRPGFRISIRHLRDLYGFSLNITGMDILWFFAQRSDQTLVGYGFGSYGLGPYSLASRLGNLLHDTVMMPLQSVAFPAFSRLQKEQGKLEDALHAFCEMSSFVTFPMFAGVAAIAPELISVVFGPRWISAAPILQILALYGAVRVVLDYGHPLLLAKGRSGLYFVLNIILAVLTFIGCFVSVRWSPKAIALSMAATMLVFAVIFVGCSAKYLGVRIRSLLRTFLFPFASSLVMLAVVLAIRQWIGGRYSPRLTIAVCVASGVLVYSFAAILMKRPLVIRIWQLFLHSLPARNFQASTELYPAEPELGKAAIETPREFAGDESLAKVSSSDV